MALEDLTTGQDLMYYVLGFGGQSQSSTDDYASHVKAALRQNYWEVLAMEPWLFALKTTPGTISTLAEQSVTVSSISGTQVTLSASIATSMADRKFYLDSLQVIYRITAHTAGTATLTLDASWAEDTTSGPGTIFQDEYSLASDCMVLWGPMTLRGNADHEIEIVGDKQFKAKHNDGGWPVTGPPDVATQIRYDSNGYPRIQLAPVTSDAMVLEYDYTRFHNLDFSGSGAGDTPLLPVQDRWMLAERSLWTLWRNKNSELAASAWNRAEDHLSVMRTRYLPNDSRPRAWVRFRNNLGA
jgi:hypothetical protein